MPSRASQSKLLLQEADTTSEWDQAAIAKFMSIKSPLSVPQAPELGQSRKKTPQPPEVSQSGLVLDLQRVCASIVDQMDSSKFIEIEQFWKTERGLPRDVDSPLLGKCRDAIQRDLTPLEKKQARALVIASLKERFHNPPDQSSLDV